MYTYSDDVDPKCYDVYLRKAAGNGAVATGYFDQTDPAWALDGFVRSSDAGETSLVEYKDDLTTTNFYIASADACWVKIGVLDGEPSLITSEGEKIPLATCNDKVISKKIDIDFTSLSVTADNWDEMVALMAYNIDVLFVETGNVGAATTGNGIGAAYLQMDVNLEIKGNAPNRMPFKISKEVGDITKFVNFVDVQI